MPFPKSDPRRWLLELRDLSQRHPGTWKVVSTEPATVTGEVDTAAGLKFYRIIWPPEFPLRPPSIWELHTVDGDVVDHRSTGHAFTDRSICLFGHIPEIGWRPSLTAAMAVDRLRTFLEATDRCEFPLVDALPLEIPLARVSIHPRVMATIKSNVGWGVMSGFLRADERLVMVTGAELTSATGLTTGSVSEAPVQAWGQALHLSSPWHGLWCRVDVTLGDEPPNRERLAAWLSHKIPYDRARDAILSQPFVLLVGDEAAWFIWLNPPEALRAALAPTGQRALYTVPFVEDIPSKLFARAEARLENAASLRAARVAIIGLGSLGGTIAVALAKTGVGRFTLFDPEVLEPENVARHVGGVLDIGIPKVEVVARAIRRVNPDADITLVPAALSLDPTGWNTDTMARLGEVLGDPHGVVVCATATTDAESVVNSACVAAGVPAIFAVVLGRAEHGRVFRVLPGTTACYQCVLMRQGAEPLQFPRFIEADVGAPAYSQPGIPGLGLDVDEVALIAARLTLQTIATRFEGGLGYPKAHGDHFLWSGRGGWAVDGPLQTRTERIPMHPDCPVCGAGRSGELDAAEQSELDGLSGLSGER